MNPALTLVCDGSSSLDRQSVAAAVPGESIVGSTLDQVLPAALEAIEEGAVERVAIVTAEPVGRPSIEARLEAAGADAVVWVDARLGAGLASTERGRVVAAATQAKLALAAAGTRPADLEPKAGRQVDPGEIVVVDAPAVAADLATHVPVTLLTSDHVDRRRPNVTVREGRALEIFDDDELTVLFESSNGADRLRPDHLVWPGYDGDADGEGVHVDTSGIVDAVLRLARERNRDPVTLDHSTCAVGRKGTAGCRACESVCPHDAVSIDVSGDGRVAIDDRACTDCGVCLGACPTESITSPRAASLEALTEATAASLEVDSDADGGFSIPFVGRDDADATPVVAFTHHDLEPLVVNARPDSVPTIPIPVSDARRVPGSLALYALAVGAGGVTLVGDPARSTDALERIAEEAGRTLEALDLEPAVSWVASNDPAAVSEALQRAHAGDTLTDRSLGRPSGKTEPRPGAPATDGGWTMTAATLSVHAIESLSSGPTADVPAPALGSIVVEAADCTLCRACDSMCPTGALDQPNDRTLRFDPSVCVGCNLCTACPEDAIDVEETVTVPVGTREPVVEHDPITCAQCGDPFGTKTGLAQVQRTLDGADLPEGLGLEYCPSCRRRGASGRDTEP